MCEQVKLGKPSVYSVLKSSRRLQRFTDDPRFEFGEDCSVGRANLMSTAVRLIVLVV